MSQITVLLADDNGPVREVLANALRAHFTLCEPVANGKQLVEAALARTPDVIVSDVWMPVLGGLEALQILRDLGRTTPFVMVSADLDIAPDCLAAGACAFVSEADVGHHLVPAVVAAANSVTYSASLASVPGQEAVVPAIRPNGANGTRVDRKL